ELFAVDRIFSEQEVVLGVRSAVLHDVALPSKRPESMFRVKADVGRQVSVCFHESEFFPGPIKYRDPSFISLKSAGVCDSDRDRAIAVNGHAHNARSRRTRQYRLEDQPPIGAPDLNTTGFIGEQEVAFVECGEGPRTVVSAIRDGPGGFLRRGSGP